MAAMNFVIRAANCTNSWNRKSIAFNHRPQRVWQQRVYCHAIKEAETTLTIKLQRPNPNEEEVGG